MKKNGFTLIELLSIVVILGITFMYILPKMVSMFKEGEKTETEIIEERVISAARDYVNYIDGSFYTKFYKEGDTNYIYKTDLINSNLIDKEEIEKLDTFAGVKGELLKDDKMKYTVEYIDVNPSSYTNEELYLMYENINNRLDNMDGGSSGSSTIDDLQSQINDNKSLIQNNINSINVLKGKNIFLDVYPIGSVFISDTNTNPGSKYGGTWELIDKRLKTMYITDDIITMNSSKAVLATGTTSYVIRRGNIMNVNIAFTNKVTFNDTSVVIGTLNFEKMGITRLSAATRTVGYSDEGNVVFIVSIDYETGDITVTDIIGADSVSSGINFHFNINIPAPISFALDSACDQFYFQRTA